MVIRAFPNFGNIYTIFYRVIDQIMKRKTFLILTFLSIAFFAYAEVEPWIMIPKGATANGSSSEAMLNTSMWGRYYTGSKSEIGFMHKVWDFTGSTDNTATTFFYNTPRHEDHQIVYYFNKKTGKYYAAIVEPKSQAAVALEFTDKQKALDIVYVWSYLKYFCDEAVNDYKVNYLPLYGETITKEYINYPDDYIKDFSGEGNTTIKLEVIKDSETIYNKIKNNGYFICDSCTRLNHGWTYVEVAGEHREFLNPDVDTWKKEVAKLHKVLTLNEIYSTFKTDY